DSIVTNDLLDSLIVFTGNLERSSGLVICTLLLDTTLSHINGVLQEVNLKLSIFTGEVNTGDDIQQAHFTFGLQSRLDNRGIEELCHVTNQCMGVTLYHHVMTILFSATPT